MGEPFTIHISNNTAVAEWDGGKMVAVPDSAINNPINNSVYVAVVFADGTTTTNTSTDTRIPEPLRVQLDQPSAYQNHYYYLKGLPIGDSNSRPLTTAENHSDPHAGMVFNPYTERWSWI